MQAKPWSEVAVSRKEDVSHSLLASPHFTEGVIPFCLAMPSCTIHICYPPPSLKASWWKLGFNDNLHVNLGPQLLEQMGNSELTAELGTLELHFGCKPSFPSLETSFC